jgi:transcriptional regulator with XRE-family HTH domain
MDGQARKSDGGGEMKDHALIAARLALVSCLALAPGRIIAETPAPYAGQDARPIAGLTVERVAGLREGAGLGYAQSAELNGFPGPQHVLELAGELDLTPQTVAAVEAIRASMRSRAQALGEALIAGEIALDALFSGPVAPAPEAIVAQTARIAAIEGQLRAVHLVAHLETAPLLSPHQRMIYARHRGYAAQGGAHGHANGHVQP